jgi:hypothetical protein
MLLQMLVNQPQMIGPVLKGTPAWVWGLLAGLLVLGLTQVRDRQASLMRLMLTPVVMTALAIWGAVSAFGNSPLFGDVMLVWMFGVAVMVAAITPMPAPRGATYDAASRTFTLPGSWLPMLLILGVFLTKYAVGVDLAMQPGLARDGQYTLIVGAIYGVFSGIFTGRALRLCRLAFRADPAAPARALNV